MLPKEHVSEENSDAQSSDVSEDSSVASGLFQTGNSFTFKINIFALKDMYVKTPTSVKLSKPGIRESLLS